MSGQYHSGEREAQRLAGERDIADSREGMVQSSIAKQVFRWLSAQSLLAVATVDPRGQLWASVLAGVPGFLDADDDGKGLSIRHAFPPATQKNVRSYGRIGLLAIDLGSRQRMRINGTAELRAEGIHVHVDEAFFNCPKYITRRAAHPASDVASGGTVNGRLLLPEHLELLRATDVLFLATMHPDRGLDVSHRGGDPGFLRILPDGRIRMPDYSGNSLFNSLGNLLIDPRISIAVPDLQTGRVLQITGRATIEWHGADEENSTGGTHRFIDIAVEGWCVEAGGPTAGSMAEVSPFNPPPTTKGKP